MRRRSGLVAAIVVLLWAPVLVPAPVSAQPASAAATCVYSSTTVAVVVDFGDGSPVSAVCVPASSTDNGAVVLAARADQLGTPPPRFNSAGLLCAIDGTPSNGCGDQTGSKYAYWSYWHGRAGSWEYSSVGPGGSRVHSDVVEGWRYQPQGGGNPNDPPPRGSADAASTCVPALATTSTSTTSVASTAPSSGANTQSSSSSGASSDAPSSAEVASVGSDAPSTSSASGAGTASGQAAGSVRINAGDNHHGSAWGLAGGGGLIVALGIGGALFAHRRRSLGP